MVSSSQAVHVVPLSAPEVRRTGSSAGPASAHNGLSINEQVSRCGRCGLRVARKARCLSQLATRNPQRPHRKIYSVSLSSTHLLTHPAPMTTDSTPKCPDRPPRFVAAGRSRPSHRHPTPAGARRRASGASPDRARARRELGRRRGERLRTANEAVDAYLRTSGTRNYQAAFAHVQRTRPELFADMQVPAHEVLAGNFNPNHDQLGRFTTRDGAVAPQDQGHLTAFGARSVRIDAVGEPQAKRRSTRAKISAGAFFPAAWHWRMLDRRRRAKRLPRSKPYEPPATNPLPKDANRSMRAIQHEVEKYGKSQGRYFDFSQTGRRLRSSDPGCASHPQRKVPIHSQPITIDRIPDALKQGPVMVAVHSGSGAHGELIIGMNKDRYGSDIPGSYSVYNPLNPVAQATLLDDSQIFKDSKGRPELFALRPYQKGEKHREDAPRSLPQANRQK